MSSGVCEHTLATAVWRTTPSTSDTSNGGGGIKSASFQILLAQLAIGREGDSSTFLLWDAY